MNIYKIIFFSVVVIVCVNGYIVDPGPAVIASKGEIWPKPKTQTTEDKFFIVRPKVLKFEVVNNFTCEILDKAIKRYIRIISSTKDRRKHNRSRSKGSTSHVSRQSWRTDPLFEGNLDYVAIALKGECEEYPSLRMDESYSLSLSDPSEASIESYSIWGILRGLESFSQMLVLADDKISFRINATEIYDEPRFPHRGLLLDTSRHFINVFTITQILDGMTYNKLNVFHWHIVDDQSFPYESKVFPELVSGAYDPSMVYSQKDVAKVIEYARIRGIRVMVEFDTPGHTRSWGISHPEILTTCGGKYAGKLGPINPIVNATYEFMEKILREIVEVFPDEYIHVGGDEVGFECWESNNDIQDYMTLHNIKTYQSLEELYIQKIVNMVNKLNASSIVWQEVFENGVHLPNGTVVHVWTGDSQLLLQQITDRGLPALLSSCWYLDHLKNGGDWKSFYGCDAYDFNGTDEQKRLILGGEACMWSEVLRRYVDVFLIGG